MLDPIITGYLADVAANVTASILGVLGNRLRQAIESTPRQKALEHCYQAALAAWLPPDDPLSKTYQPLLKVFLDEHGRHCGARQAGPGARTRPANPGRKLCRHHGRPWSATVRFLRTAGRGCRGISASRRTGARTG